MLNHTSRSRFIAQLNRSSKPHIKREYENYNKRTSDFESAGLTVYEKPDRLRGFIENIPDGQNGRQLLEDIENAHPEISNFFFSEGLGPALQFKDSQIMSEILMELIDRDIPVLPVHDSLRCKKSDLEIVVKVMQDKYQEVTGFTCKVSP